MLGTRAQSERRRSAHLLLVEPVTEILEPQAALQRETTERPAILRIHGEDALMLVLLGRMIGIHRQLTAPAARREERRRAVER